MKKTCISCDSNNISRTINFIECLNCQLKFNILNINIEYNQLYLDNKSLYSTHFKKIDFIQKHKNINKILLPFEKEIIENLKNIQPSSIVDLGCGTGRFFRAASALATEVKGYEISNEIVKKLKNYGLNCEKGGIDEFLASNLGGEVITLLEVIEHLRNPLQVIKDLIMKKSPKFIFIVVPFSEIRRKYDKNFASQDVPPNHLSWWNETAVNKLLSHEGYTVKTKLIKETRKSLLIHFYKNKGLLGLNIVEWGKLFYSPPAFWILGVAKKNEA